MNEVAFSFSLNLEPWSIDGTAHIHGEPSSFMETLLGIPPMVCLHGDSKSKQLTMTMDHHTRTLACHVFLPFCNYGIDPYLSQFYI